MSYNNPISMEYEVDVFQGSVTGDIQQDHITRRLLPHDVLVDITDSGMCGSDKFYLRAPQVLGHEGVGVVAKVGSEVNTVHVGDRVGLGYVQKVCGDCSNCRSGWDQYCEARQIYGQSDRGRGCLASAAVWDARSLISIPDGVNSADAAGLLCGGATAWTALTRYGIEPGHRVGVMGVGGLGHLAIKLGAKLGFDVVAISGSDSKKEDCLAFGAKEFCVSSSDAVKAMKPLNHLLLCGSGDTDLNFAITLMRVHGTIYPLTVSLAPAKLPLLPLINKGIRLQGSMVASHSDTTKMLQFCAENSVKPELVRFPFSSKGVEEAVEALNGSALRYKAVLSRERQ